MKKINKWEYLKKILFFIVLKVGKPKTKVPTDSVYGKSLLPGSLMRFFAMFSLGWEDPLEKEMATHSNKLAWEIP